MSTEERGLLGGMEKILLLLAIVIIAYIGFRNGGFNMVQRTEEVKIIDKPHAQWKKDGTAHYKKREQEKKEQVDAMLRDFARDFSGDKTPHTDVDWNNIDISQDEIDYYQRAPERYSGLRSSYEKASEWYAFLKTSQKTYSSLKMLFSEMTGKPEASIQADDISMLMNNDSDANTVYYKIEDLFHIPKTEIESFAQSGKKALSDWAEFIEQKNSAER